MADSDKEIIEQLKHEASKQLAFHALVKKYQSKLYWLIRKMVIDHEETNDLLQNTWIKVWNNLGQFREDSQLYTWLYRIASNEALTHLRNKKKRFFIPIHDLSPELEQKVNLDPQLSGNKIEHMLYLAMVKLPEKQRLVFQLKYFEEMTYEEMAQVVNTSVGALKASYHLASKKIEEELKFRLNHRGE